MAARELTETLMALDLIAKGKSEKEAARLCGVHVSSVYRAKKRAEKRKNLANSRNNLVISPNPLDLSHDAPIITTSTTNAKTK